MGHWCWLWHSVTLVNNENPKLRTFICWYVYDSEWGGLPDMKGHGSIRWWVKWNWSLCLCGPEYCPVIFTKYMCNVYNQITWNFYPWHETFMKRFKAQQSTLVFCIVSCCRSISDGIKSRTNVTININVVNILQVVMIFLWNYKWHSIHPVVASPVLQEKMSCCYSNNAKITVNTP